MSGENKKRLKEYKKIIVRLICKYVYKSALQNCYCKNIFWLFLY